MKSAKTVTKKKTTPKKSTTPKTKRTPVQHEEPLGDLASRAMLVDLDISQWAGSKKDQAASEKVTTEAGANRRRASVVKTLVDSQALNVVHSLTNAARKAHWLNTLPWTDGGYRIMTSAGYFTYTQMMQAFRVQFEEAVALFVEQYSTIIEEQQAGLGTLFNSEDYPSPSEMRGLFRFNLVVRGVPQSQDFRVKLAHEDAQQIRKSIDDSVKQSVGEAMVVFAQRIVTFASHAADRLRKYDVDKEGKVHNKFHDTLVDNIAEIAALIPAFNLTADPRLNDIQKELQAIAQHTPKALKADAKLRTSVADAADDIVKKMKAYF